MAIDTDEKKFSSMNMGMPFRMNIPIPSQVGFTDAQKQQMLFQYSGMSWAGALISAGIKVVSAITVDIIQAFTGIVDKIQSFAKIR